MWPKDDCLFIWFCKKENLEVQVLYSWDSLVYPTPTEMDPKFCFSHLNSAWIIEKMNKYLAQNDTHNYFISSVGLKSPDKKIQKSFTKTNFVSECVYVYRIKIFTIQY